MSTVGCIMRRVRCRSTPLLHVHVVMPTLTAFHTHSCTRLSMKKNCPGAYIHRQDEPPLVTRLPGAHTLQLKTLSRLLLLSHTYTHALMLQHLLSQRGRRGAKSEEGENGKMTRNRMLCKDRKNKGEFYNEQHLDW